MIDLFSYKLGYKNGGSGGGSSDGGMKVIRACSENDTENRAMLPFAGVLTGFETNMYKVSDDIPTLEELEGGFIATVSSVTDVDGQTYFLSSNEDIEKPTLSFDEDPTTYIITMGYPSYAPLALFMVIHDAAMFQEMFPDNPMETGIYSANVSDSETFKDVYLVYGKNA